MVWVQAVLGAASSPDLMKPSVTCTLVSTPSLVEKVADALRIPKQLMTSSSAVGDFAGEQEFGGLNAAGGEEVAGGFFSEVAGVGAVIVLPEVEHRPRQRGGIGGESAVVEAVEHESCVRGLPFIVDPGDGLRALDDEFMGLSGGGFGPGGEAGIVGVAAVAAG